MRRPITLTEHFLVEEHTRTGSKAGIIVHPLKVDTMVLRHAIRYLSNATFALLCDSPIEAPW